MLPSDMADLILKRKQIASALILALIPTILASILVHLVYTVNYGTGSGDWFRSLPMRHDLAWITHLTAIFGPGSVLIVLYTRKTQNALLLFLAGLLTWQAYQSWQPFPLQLLSILELYPTHLEAFQNFAWRGDWLLYE